jgi:hypothetical protein
MTTPVTEDKRERRTNSAPRFAGVLCVAAMRAADGVAVASHTSPDSNSDEVGRPGLTGTANTLELRPAAGAEPGAVARALFAIPGVASVEPAAAIPDALRGYICR